MQTEIPTISAWVKINTVWKELSLNYVGEIFPLQFLHQGVRNHWKDKALKKNLPHHYKVNKLFGHKNVLPVKIDQTEYSRDPHIELT